GKVFGEIQAALPFLFVYKITVPIRLVLVAAVVQSDDPWEAGIRAPHQTFVADFRVKLKRGIFMVQRVVVTPRKKWSHGQHSFRRCIQRSPDEGDNRGAVDGEDFLLNLSAVLHGDNPFWP